MTRKWKIVLGVGAPGAGRDRCLGGLCPGSSVGDQATPKSFNWEIKDGKRVPKGQTQTNADGSWREEIRQGKCVTVKEKSAAGEYKETRKCD